MRGPFISTVKGTVVGLWNTGAGLIKTLGHRSFRPTVTVTETGHFPGLYTESVTRTVDAAMRDQALRYNTSAEMSLSGGEMSDVASNDDGWDSQWGHFRLTAEKAFSPLQQIRFDISNVLNVLYAIEEKVINFILGL
ncbi:MAG: hypothetical protein ABH823_02600 [bacterium]